MPQDSKIVDEYIKSRKYHCESWTYYGRVEETFGRGLPKIEKGTILDWGCSGGKTTIELATLYPNSTIIGIDIVAKNLTDASQHTEPAGFLLADGFRPPFPDETFDAVFCMNNIYLMSLWRQNETVARELPKISRIIKPERYLLISGGSTFIIFKKQNGIMKTHQTSYRGCTLTALEDLF